MLRLEVISDLNLASHGLRMIPCDPAIQVPFPDEHVVPWWVDRERARKEFSKISAKHAARFVQVDDQLKKLARYLQPFFMEPPPEVDTSTGNDFAGSQAPGYLNSIRSLPEVWVSFSITTASSRK